MSTAVDGTEVTSRSAVDDPSPGDALLLFSLLLLILLIAFPFLLLKLFL